MTPREKIETLRRLHGEATPGPWYAIPHPKWTSAPHRIDTRPDVPYENFGELARMGATTAALVVAMERALPALLDVAEAAVRHIEEKFTCDDGDVEKCDLGPEECSACNLEQALARLGEGVMEDICDGDHEYGDCHGTGSILCTWCGAAATCQGCRDCENEEEWDE